MIKRWLIRLPFLLALALVVGVWVTSYFGGIGVGGWRRGRNWDIVVVQGNGMLKEDPVYSYPRGPMDFIFARNAKAKSWGVEPMTFGFRIGQLGFPTNGGRSPRIA